MSRGTENCMASVNKTRKSTLAPEEIMPSKGKTFCCHDCYLKSVD